MNDPQLISSAFDEAAIGYDRSAMRFFDNSAARLVTSLKLKGNENVLDAATGTGKIALTLARHLPQGQVTGVDLSAGMLHHARKKAENYAVPNVTFHQGDVDTFTAPTPFDGITCGFGVHFWTHMEKSLSRLATLVKPGGFVAITSFAKGSFEPTASLCLKRFADYGVQLPPTYSLERLDHPDKNRQLLESIGLHHIQMDEQQVGYYLESAADWWDLVLYTGYRAFLNKLSPEQSAKFKKEFLAEVEATKSSKGVFLNVMVITAIGKK